MPVIVGELKGFNIYAWVFTAYLISSAVTVPIYGKLSDVYGRKPFYAFGLGLFIVGSALSGRSQSMMELIIFRGLQGIGAGAMLSMPRATIGDIFNPRERGRWMGVIATTFGLASIVGPFLGGWITDHLGWRWVFYINLPVAIAALVMILFALPRVRVERTVQVDWLGTSLLVLGLVPMLLAFTWAGSRYPWGSPIIVGIPLSFCVSRSLRRPTSSAFSSALECSAPFSFCPFTSKEYWASPPKTRAPFSPR
jgi:multidrug resistance protein